MPGSLQAHQQTTGTSAVLPTAPEDESAGSGARRLSQCPPAVAAKLANSLACTSLENLYSLYSSCSLQFSSNASSPHWVPIAPAPSFTESSDAQLKHNLHQITMQAHLSLSVMIRRDSYRLSLQKRTLPFLLLLHIAWFYPVSQDGKPMS